MGSAGPPHRGMIFFRTSAVARVRYSFLEPNLQSDRVLLDVQLPEISLVDELLELAFGIGTLEQHETEYQFGNSRIQQIQAHFIRSLVDRFPGTISSQVEN